jgi:ubiquinone/menaquinone biosynthesis C-methylase UbiE
MLPNDLLNYLKEISRILKTNGRCFATFFIINKAKLHNDNFTSFFKFIHENYRLKTENIPEEAIAYEENYLKEIFSNLGFKTIHPFHPIKIKDQDFIILEK